MSDQSRQARQSRPQLICVLADNSNSMEGPKADAATEGIQEMLVECQSTGPAGADRSYFRFLLITFDSEARVDPNCQMTPVRLIDPSMVRVTGDGGKTNITNALELALEHLRPYVDELKTHPELNEHPVPLVLLFSDGQHNDRLAPPPGELAGELRKLTVDGLPVVVACAGVSVDGDRSDDETLKRIASPECFVPVERVEVLTQFLASVASSGFSRVEDVAGLINDEMRE